MDAYIAALTVPKETQAPSHDVMADRKQARQMLGIAVYDRVHHSAHHVSKSTASKQGSQSQVGGGTTGSGTATARNGSAHRIRCTVQRLQPLGERTRDKHVPSEVGAMIDARHDE